MITYPRPDELTNRYYDLANIQAIPNIARYALEWETLAADARAAGRLSSAAAWQARADFYKAQAGGEYIRLIDGSFSELIPCFPASLLPCFFASVRRQSGRCWGKLKRLFY